MPSKKPTGEPYHGISKSSKRSGRPSNNASAGTTGSRSYDTPQAPPPQQEFQEAPPNPFGQSQSSQHAQAQPNPYGGPPPGQYGPAPSYHSGGLPPSQYGPAPSYHSGGLPPSQYGPTPRINWVQAPSLPSGRVRHPEALPLQRGNAFEWVDIPCDGYCMGIVYRIYRKGNEAFDIKMFPHYVDNILNYTEILEIGTKKSFGKIYPSVEPGPCQWHGGGKLGGPRLGTLE